MTEDNDNILILNAPVARKITEMKTFTDDEGRTVVGQFPVGSKDAPSFSGTFMVGTNVGPIRLGFEFAAGTTLEKCFDQFDVLAKKTFEEEKAKSEAKSRIVTPQQASKRNIIIP